VAVAIYQGLEMDRDERRKRMRRMRRHVMDHNIYRWAASILGDLRDLRMESPETADPSNASSASLSSGETMQRKLV
jgi:trehalose 6-phosphate synthase